MSKTYNHPHWSEGAWDSPVISPDIGLDDLFANSPILTDPNHGPPLEEHKLPGIVEIIGGLLTDLFGWVLDGAGKILSGAWDVVTDVFDGFVGLLGGLAEGFGNMIGHIGNAIGHVFGGSSWGQPDLPPEPPEVFSPIKVNLEEMLEPHFDKIDQTLAALEESDGRIDTMQDALQGKIDGQFAMIDQLKDLNDNLDQKIEASLEHSEYMSGLIADMEAIGSGVQDALMEELGEVTGQLDTLVNSFDSKVESYLQKSNTISNIQTSLDDKVSSQSSLIGELTDLNQNFDSKVAGTPKVSGLDEDYKILNTRLWGKQGAVNEENSQLWENQGLLNQLQADMWSENGEMWKTQNEINLVNKRLWGEQGELNELNRILWGEQEKVNTGNIEKWQTQGLVNQLQAEMWEEQGEINQLVKDLSEEQQNYAQVQAELAKNFEEMQKLQMETVSRSVFLQTGTVLSSSHPHFSARESGDHWHITAKGSWVGTIIFEGSLWTPNGWEPSHEQRTVRGTSTADRTFNNVIGKGRNAVLTYFIEPGKPGVRNRSGGTYDPAKPNVWYTINTQTFSVTDNSGHYIYWDVGWDAADRGSQYGIRVVLDRGGSQTEIVSSGLRSNIGPRFPWENGFRRQTVTMPNYNLRAGDRLLFQVRSGGSRSSQRRVRNHSSKIMWVKQPNV